ncbi:hypothetical protein QJS10_CPA16g00019 [Acorus calamus]|uniref:Uncharacterized protein n=1 Tax=Acorus calamus TaxID=4465 RepID=A0AAV9D2F7_ACOCL|nr:hypothetical protein QJS10_CPA16g00019 [Acorus calamus]
MFKAAYIEHPIRYCRIHRITMKIKDFKVDKVSESIGNWIWIIEIVIATKIEMCKAANIEQPTGSFRMKAIIRKIKDRETGKISILILNRTRQTIKSTIMQS